MRYFNELALGDIIESGEYLVTREDIISMAKQWDPQPFHIDEDVAKKGMFGDVIACTAHIFCIMSKLSTDLPEESKLALVSGLGIDKGKLLVPVKPNDTLKIIIEIIELRRSESKPNWGITVAQHKLYNQHGQKVFSIDTSALIDLSKPASS